jgi:limonene-1,2-epoxide hydrolase
MGDDTDTAAFLALLASWADGNAAFATGIRALFSDDCIWDQPPIGGTIGPDEAIALVQGMDASGLASIRVECRNVATAGGVIFTERYDEVLGPDGSVVVALPVVGVTEMRDGKIVAWREYFDSGALHPEG